MTLIRVGLSTRISTIESLICTGYPSICEVKLSLFADISNTEVVVLSISDLMRKSSSISVNSLAFILGLLFHLLFLLLLVFLCHLV